MLHNLFSDPKFNHRHVTIWYQTREVFRMLSVLGVKAASNEVTIALGKSHKAIVEFYIDDQKPLQICEQAFHWMQGEVWSNGSYQATAQQIIRDAGLSHTSMCIGDIVQVDERYFACELAGFEEITDLINESKKIVSEDDYISAIDDPNVTIEMAREAQNQNFSTEIIESLLEKLKGSEYKWTHSDLSNRLEEILILVNEHKGSYYISLDIRGRVKMAMQECRVSLQANNPYEREMAMIMTKDDHNIFCDHLLRDKHDEPMNYNDPCLDARIKQMVRTYVWVGSNVGRAITTEGLKRVRERL